MRQAKELCRKYGIALRLIPKRQVKAADIGELFRGPMIPILARRVDRDFGKNEGVINAALIGDAARDSIVRPGSWNEFGDDVELFSRFKQLWHTVAYFG